MKTLFTTIPKLESERLVLRELTRSDAAELQACLDSPRVYRYLPTFLFEHKYQKAEDVIDRLYTECLSDSLILGIFRGGAFCGLAEFYGYRAPIRKISVGYRLAEPWWGKGLATETLGRMISYLENETDIEIITASTLPDNHASAAVLQKNGFTLVVKAAPEDWGFGGLTPTDKWIR